MHLWTSDIERESRNKHWITYNIFNKWYWSNYMDTCRITQIISYLSLSQTSKWIETLNIKQDTLKLVGNKVGNSLEHFGIGKRTDYNTDNTGIMVNNKWDLMKLKTICMIKDIII